MLFRSASKFCIILTRCKHFVIWSSHSKCNNRNRNQNYCCRADYNCFLFSRPAFPFFYYSINNLSKSFMLLFAEKGDILAFLEEKKIPWREDITNQDTAYQRNWIRRPWDSGVFGFLIFVVSSRCLWPCLQAGSRKKQIGFCVLSLTRTGRFAGIPDF